MRRAICAVAMLSLTAACANTSSVYRRPDLNDGRSLVIDNEQAAIIFTRRDRPYIYCAQPAPDAIGAESAAASLWASLAEQGEGEAAAALGQSVASMGLRTQSIQLLRDAFYRLCEGYAGGGLDAYEYGILTRRFQSNMLAILAIEQLTGAVTGPSVVAGATGTSSVAAAEEGSNPQAGASTTSATGSQSPAYQATLTGSGAQAVAEAVTRITLNAVNQDYMPQMCIELLRLNNSVRAELDELCIAYLAQYMEASLGRMVALNSAYVAVATNLDLPAGERDALLAQLSEALTDSVPIASMPAPSPRGDPR